MAIINLAGPTSGNGEALNASGSPTVVADPFTPSVCDYCWRYSVATSGAAYHEFGTISGVTTQAAENVGATRYFGFDFAYATKPASNDEVFFRSHAANGGSKFTIRLHSDGKIRAYGVGGTTLLGTGATVLAANTWYRFSVKVGHGSSADWEVWINGSLELSGSGADLSTSNYVHTRLGKPNNTNNQTVDYYLANLVIENASLPPDGYKIAAGVPNGNGTDTDFSGSYTDVDERPNDGDTTYSELGGTLASGNETYTLAWAGVPSGTVHAVKALVLGYRGGGTTANNEIRIRSGGSASNTSEGTVFTFSPYQQRHRLMLMNPVTAAAWTPSEVAALEIGIAKTNAVTPTVRITQAIGTCMYVPASAGAAGRLVNSIPLKSLAGGSLAG